MNKILTKVKQIKFQINLFTVLLLVLTFTIGWQLGHRDYKVQWQNNQPKVSVDNRQVPDDINIDFKLFWETWDLVNKTYVDKKALDPQKMYYGAIQGMVAAIGDPYTVFLPPAAQKSTKEELGGSFSGIGIELGYSKDKHLVVIAPLSGTPAEAAGVKAGDYILKVDGKDASNMTLPDAVSIIRGPKDTTISLQIYHEGDKAPIDVSIKRDTIVVKSVTFSQKVSPQGKKIAYIKLSRFGEKTETEWQEAVNQVLASGSQGLVLDLRNNPGGFLDGAVFIGSEFISSGNIVMQENAAGERQGYPVDRIGKLLDIPMMVLINKGSASASEIVSGAIQDNSRGKLVGDQSFGKGTIQTTQDLANDTGIHITIAKWLTPGGRWIHTTGLTPDVKVEFGDDQTKDLQLEKSLELFD